MSYTVTFKFALGVKVKDRVSNFVGIVDQRNEMLNGCLRYSITGQIDDKGDYKGYWIDEQQLEFVDDGLNKVNPVKKTKTGGAVTKSQTMQRSN